MSEQTPAVELKNVSKVFGNNKVINGVDLVIPQRSFVTFLGPSGCGKTTLLRMIAGFYEADEGEIYIKGRRVDNIPPYARNTAMVFQEYALFPHMTVAQNVAYGLQVQKYSKDETERKVTEALHLMQLTGLEGRYPHQMSGGQQQRVAVARALVMNPDALLLDEPLSNLDAKLRESVRVELRLIQKQLELTAIYVTHDQQEALAMSDLIVILNRGSIHQVGTAREIYYHPNSRFVADFIGTTNLIDITVESADKALYRDIPVPLSAGQGGTHRGEGSISIRPESIRIRDSAEEGCFNLPIEVRHGLFLGEKMRYLVDDRHGKQWIVDSFDPGEKDHSGSAWLVIEPDKPHVIPEIEKR